MRVLFTLAAVLLVALVPPTARASHLKEQPKKHKIVYHLDEAGLDKARSVLGNIENHIRGVGGADHIEAIELVVHGAALRNFVTASMDVALRAALDRLQRSEEHTSELQSRPHLVCRLLLEKKKHRPRSDQPETQPTKDPFVADTRPAAGPVHRRFG